jgi:uncharacterized membrane protein
MTIGLVRMTSELIRLAAWLSIQPLFWAIAGVTFGPYLFYRGFLMLQLKRRMINVPRSNIR